MAEQAKKSSSCDAVLLNVTIQTNGLGMCSVEGQSLCGVETRQVIENIRHGSWNESQKRHVSVSNLHPYSRTQ